MEKVEQYRKRARDCRDMFIKGPSPEIREHYQQLAEMWDKMAEERLRFFVAKDLDEAG